MLWDGRLKVCQAEREDCTCLPSTTKPLRWVLRSAGGSLFALLPLRQGFAIRKAWSWTLEGVLGPTVWGTTRTALNPQAAGLFSPLARGS